MKPAVCHLTYRFEGLDEQLLGFGGADDERCILCSRCVRFTREVSHSNGLGIESRGDHSLIRPSGEMVTATSRAHPSGVRACSKRRIVMDHLQGASGTLDLSIQL